VKRIPQRARKRQAFHAHNPVLRHGHGGVVRINGRLRQQQGHQANHERNSSPGCRRQVKQGRQRATLRDDAEDELLERQCREQSCEHSELQTRSNQHSLTRVSVRTGTVSTPGLPRQCEAPNLQRLHEAIRSNPRVQSQASDGNREWKPQM
jgi:hypothetical protein